MITFLWFLSKLKYSPWVSSIKEPLFPLNPRSLPLKKKRIWWLAHVVLSKANFNVCYFVLGRGEGGTRISRRGEKSQTPPERRVCQKGSQQGFGVVGGNAFCHPVSVTGSELLISLIFFPILSVMLRYYNSKSFNLWFLLCSDILNISQNASRRKYVQGLC